YNYSGATTLHANMDDMPVGNGGFLKYASTREDPKYISDAKKFITEADIEMLPWLSTMHTALVIPTISITAEKATTVLFAFKEDAYDMNTIKHNVMLTYATTDIILNLILRQETTRAWGALDAELETIGRIQREFLPKELPGMKGVECAVHYATSTRAGGDYYDFFPLADDRTGIFIADVAGHGSPAAIVMAMTRLLLHTYPRETSPPEDVFAHLNKMLFGNLLPGQFVTAFYAILDTTERVLSFSNAGHCHPILIRAADKSALLLKTKGGLPLGIVPNGTFDMKSVKVNNGDLLFFFTDGLVEAMDCDKLMFGDKRLNDILTSAIDSPPESIKDRILDALKEFCGNMDLKDDLTFIIMKITC
ncbi:MAG: PP2C family protein-serine/threonine phosphatase, partial [Proteobacteria bacterium]|nr:PP2C family protein-serine/threonine phosphatase [Pseudomonadota bacterium]